MPACCFAVRLNRCVVLSVLFVAADVLSSLYNNDESGQTRSDPVTQNYRVS